jgi:excisionase family DNA binding protein
MEAYMTESIKPAMTVKEVASFLSVDEKTIYRLVQQGKLPGFKVAGAWRFQFDDIKGWISEQKSLMAPTMSLNQIVSSESAPD